MTRITKAQAAYLAGLLDGEGYFQPGGKNTNSFGIRIQMIDRGPLERAAEIAGGWVTNGSLTSSGNRAYSWGLQSKAAVRRCIKAIRPHLCLKGPEADKLIELIDHLDTMPRWRRKSSEISPIQRKQEGRREARRAWEARREELREELKQIKHDRRVGVR